MDGSSGAVVTLHCRREEGEIVTKILLNPYTPYNPYLNGT
jgi:hypothetical protein